MSAGLSGVITGLPSLLGVLLGIRAYTGGCPWILGYLALIGLAFVAMWCGKALLHKSPRLAAWIVETWIFAAVGVTALTTSFIVWLALSPIPEFLGPVSSAETSKVSVAFVAAVTTYFAVAWTKDISDAKGYFWPSTQFKDGLKQAYGRMKRKPVNGSPEYEAMFEEFVTGHGVLGWGFTARRSRAWILSEFLNAPPSANAALTVLLAVHRLKDFDEWLKLFESNPPPKIGRWRMLRGIDDPNRVHIVAELQSSEVKDVKGFMDSDRMKDVFKRVNAMSTAPLEFIWLEEQTP